MNTEEIVKELRMFSTTELCDGMEEPRVLDPAIRRMVTEQKIVGPAFPVEVPEGASGIIPDALLEIQPGQVLVIAGHGFCRGSYWGDYRSICAAMCQVEGVVIDGAFRDREGCREAGVPVFARTSIPCAAGKALEVRLNVPVMLGEVPVRPGDFVVGDEDGVVIIPPEEAEAIMERARKKMALEAAAIRKMRETGQVLPRANLMQEKTEK